MDKKAKISFIGAFIMVGALLVAVAVAAPAKPNFYSYSSNYNAPRCNDSDGGVSPATFGIATILYGGRSYQYADSCVDAKSVKEYYCSRPNANYASLVQMSCGPDGYSGSNYCWNGSVVRDYVRNACASGACGSTKTKVVQQNCGVASSIDLCANGNVYTNTTTPGCNAAVCTSSTSITLKQTCQYGCTAGACNPGQPDLVVANLTAWKTVSNGTVYVNVVAAVKNAGVATAAASTTRLAGIYSATYNLSTNSLPPGETAYVSQNYLCFANHTATATADYNANVAESNEGNNHASSYIDCLP